MFSLFHPGANAQAFAETISVLVKHNALIRELTLRELGSRYAGQWMGSFWTIAHPLFLMGLYIFVFGIVMQNRLGGTREMPFDYTAFILTGIIPWMFSQEVMAKATTAIIGNSGLVKQVVFPIEILPITSVYTASISSSIAFTGLAVYMISTGQGHIHMLPLLPVIIIFHLMFLIGLAYIFSAVSVFFRDMKDLVQLFTTAGIFLAPIVYSPLWVPAIFKPVIYLNPFSYIIWCYRDVLYYGRFENPWAWAVTGLLSFLTFTLGYRIFRKFKPLFGDAL